MAESPKKNENMQTELNEYVALVCIDSMDQAREYEILLQNEGIPVVINEDYEPSMGSAGIAVMIPEDYIDEGHLIIEAQDAYTDFYDLEGDEDDLDIDPDSDYFLSEEDF